MGGMTEKRDLTQGSCVGPKEPSSARAPAEPSGIWLGGHYLDEQFNGMRTLYPGVPRVTPRNSKSLRKAPKAGT